MPDFFAADEVTGRPYDARLMRRLLCYIRPYWKLALVGIVLGTMGTLLNIATFFVQSLVVADLDPHRTTPPAFVDWLWRLCGSEPVRGMGSHLEGLTLLFAAVIFFVFFVEIAHYYCLQLFGQKVVYDIRVQLFRYLLSLPLFFYQKNPVGRLVTRVSNDVQSLQEFVANGFIDITRHIFLMAAVVVALPIIAWKLGWMMLSVFPLLIAITMIFRYFARIIYRRIRKEIARLNSFLSENIRGMSLIQLFHREEKQRKAFTAINDQLTAAYIFSIRNWALYIPTVSVLKGICQSALIYFGCRYVYAGEIDIATLSLFTWLINLYFEPIRQIAEKYNILQSAMASCERIFKIFDTPADPALLPATPCSATSGKESTADDYLPPHETIEFDHVSFSYEEGPEVLHDINLKIRIGSTVALVGHTGAGKTTLIKLLLRFHDPVRGRILVDGTDLREIPATTWRKWLALVPQQVFLFRGDILDNIRLSNPQIGEEEVEKAARVTCVHEFVSRYAKGYRHPLEEGGRTVSAGERQLLSFARALAYRPAILVLDEATSLIDTQTERLVQQALARLLENRTNIIIAHRLSTIQHANQIVVVDQGRIVEIGTHQNLLTQPGVYHNLYQLQNG
jgi:ABC-type multidrug transport system fused ATPase/permease subunit